MISLKSDKLILALIDSVGKSTDADAISNSWKQLEDYIEQLEEHVSNASWEASARHAQATGGTM